MRFDRVLPELPPKSQKFMKYPKISCNKSLQGVAAVAAVAAAAAVAAVASSELLSCFSQNLRWAQRTLPEFLLICMQDPDDGPLASEHP